MTPAFQPVAPQSWQARVPFSLDCQTERKSDLSIELPELAPGWYSLFFAPRIAKCPKWAGAWADIRMSVALDTENSTNREENTIPVFISEFRKLGSEPDGNFGREAGGPPMAIDSVNGWPWGEHRTQFHLTAPHQPHFVMNLWGGSPGETVAGWVHLLLKREDA